MQFHKHLYLLKSHIKKIIGISESLIAIRVDLTNLDQGRRIDENVGGTLGVITKGSQASKYHKPELSIFIRSECMLV